MSDIQNHKILVDGLSFNVRVEGKANAPWLVFSNSLLTDLSLWDDQVAAFGDRFRILRYDQRGHGGSETPPQEGSFDRLAQDLEGILDALRIPAATFIGVSMGVGTLLALAERSPDRIQGLVLADGPPRTPDGGYGRVDANIEKMIAEGVESYVEPTVDRWFPASFHKRAPERVEKVRGMIRRASVNGYVACSRALQNYDSTSTLAKLPVVPLLVCGAEDGNMPALMKPMHAAIGAGKFAIIPDCGHLPCIEQPELFNAELAHYLKLG